MHLRSVEALPRQIPAVPPRSRATRSTARAQMMAGKQEELIIVKLGGAALTVKSASKGALRPEVLKHCAEALRDAWQPRGGPAPAQDASMHPRCQLVVVHGAGSFGHPEAKAYGVSTGLPGGWGTDSSQQQDASTTPEPSHTDIDRLREGVAVTRLAVTRLNLAVVDALVSEGVPAVGISPFGSWATSGKQLVSSGLEAVIACLKAGLVPVLHGDVVLDSQQGATILSGDRVVSHLAEALQPTRVVFLTDVAGVYDRPPGPGSGAQLVRHIQCTPEGAWSAAVPAHKGTASSEAGHAAQEVQLSSAAAGAHDTTGGMAAKVAEAVAVARLGTPVLIAEAGTEHAHQACCSSLNTLLQDATGGREQQGSEQSHPWQGTAVVLKAG